MENNVVKVQVGMEYKHQYRLLDSKMDIIEYKLLGLTVKTRYVNMFYILGLYIVCQLNSWLGLAETAN